MMGGTSPSSLDSKLAEAALPSLATETAESELASLA